MANRSDRGDYWTAISQALAIYAKTTAIAVTFEMMSANKAVNKINSIPTLMSVLGYQA